MAKALSYDEDETVIDGSATDLTDIQDNIDDELNRICSEIDDDSGDVQFRIKVYRIIRDKGERAWLFDALPSELPILPRLRDEYDGGEFETIIYRKNRIFKRRKMVVETPKKQPMISPRNSDIESVLKYVTTGMSQLAEAVKELKTQPVQPPVDQMTQMKQMIEIMVMMKSLQSEPQKPAFDTMEVFSKGVEFAKELAVNSDGEVSTGQMVLSAIQNLGKPLLEMASRSQAMPVQKPVQRQPQLAPSKTMPLQNQAPLQNPASRQPIQTEDNNDMSIITNMIQSRLAKDLPYLCKKAWEGKSAELQAALIVEEIDPSYHQLVGNFLLEETWFERLANAEPNITKYREWFEDLRMFILEELGMIEPENDLSTEEMGESTPDLEKPLNGNEEK